ncbi:MAG: threonyl-tRNA synthetase editing domain-containing protein [Methanomicrobiales archaeon]|nr:threonyl-tRNA synthetase editing domain-containing protein [Methanomicrobiales archaeon]MDI6875629.1 threonyl-tRNA synthetase editing domain-containing protein [Methanomicrobiales archaeon]
MRILLHHADRIWYRATRRTRIAEELGEREGEMHDCAVLFCCIEKLDEMNPGHVIESAKENILERLGRLKVSRVMLFPYAHLTSTLGSPEVALLILDGLLQGLRSEGLEVQRAPFGWYKEYELKNKGHPLADLSMTLCPYEGRECDFLCPYCYNPLRSGDVVQARRGEGAAAPPE